MLCHCATDEAYHCRSAEFKHNQLVNTLEIKRYCEQTPKEWLCGDQGSQRPDGEGDRKRSPLPGAVVGLDYLEGSPPKRLHRMWQGLFALLTWQQTVLGKGLPKHPTVEASLCPSPHLCETCGWSSRPCCSLNAFVTLLIRWLQPYHNGLEGIM